MTWYLLLLLFPDTFLLPFLYCVISLLRVSCDRGTKESFSEVFMVVMGMGTTMPSTRSPWTHLLSEEWRRGPEDIRVDITKDTRQKIKQLELI